MGIPAEGSSEVPRKSLDLGEVLWTSSLDVLEAERKYLQENRPSIFNEIWASLKALFERSDRGEESKNSSKQLKPRGFFASNILKTQHVVSFAIPIHPQCPMRSDPRL